MGENKGDGLLTSRGVEKLAETVDGIVEFIAGPERLVKRAEARGRAAILAAEAQSHVSEIAANTAERLRNVEYRRQRNIESITVVARERLAAPGSTTSDDPVDPDFVHRFFEEAHDIGNEEMQKIWGLLLAGEVKRPGTFHPRTLRILKDMTSKDAEIFADICRFTIKGEYKQLVVFDHDAPIYNINGITFDALQHLDNCGLIIFEGRDEYGEEVKSSDFELEYFDKRARISSVPGVMLTVGVALFTEAGRELFSLVQPQPVAGFDSYLFERWRSEGVTVEVYAE